MAETPPSQEELQQRRRARRRLVGAVALALLAVVVLPMVFDPEPRPLGDAVDIRIPDRTTPFEPVPAVEPAAPEPVPSESMPTEEPAAAPEPPEVVKPAPETKPAEVKTPPPLKAEAKPEAKPAPVAKSEVKAEVKPEVKAKPDAKPKPEAKPHEVKSQEAKPAKPTAAGDYYLQLGVFSSRANADQQIAKAKVAGFKATALAAGSKFKVRVGPIPDRAKALDYQTKLKSRGLDNVLVEP